MVQTFSWDEIVGMFRLLGGTAENIVRLSGGGRGLRVGDRERPVHLRVPRILMFRAEDVEFVDEQARLKKTADVGDAERLFFDRYQTSLSWGAGGRSEAESFVDQFDALPADVRALLAEEFGFASLLHGSTLERAQKWFLKSRVLHLGGSDFVAPMIELANHGPNGLTWFGEEGLNIRGMVSDELRVAHGAYDSFSQFRTFGLVRSEPPGAFSLPTEVQFPDRRLCILQDTDSCVQDGKVRVPSLKFEDGLGTLPFVVIGHRGAPQQPRGIFRAAAAEAQIEKPDEVFDVILQFNWGSFLKLLMALEPHEGDAVVTLRKVVRYQLDTMSYCVGGFDDGAKPSTREEAKPPAKQDVWSLSIS